MKLKLKLKLSGIECRVLQSHTYLGLLKRWGANLMSLGVEGRREGQKTPLLARRVG